MLRFDGLYVGPPTTSNDGALIYYDYLRFYEDGLVIECVSLGTPEQVIRWFYRGNPQHSFTMQDHYVTDGDQIAFSPEFRDMDEGEEIVMKSDYRGHLPEDGAFLELTVSGPNSGVTHRARYSFVKLP